MQGGAQQYMMPRGTAYWQGQSGMLPRTVGPRTHRTALATVLYLHGVMGDRMLSMLLVSLGQTAAEQTSAAQLQNDVSAAHVHVTVLVSLRSSCSVSLAVLLGFPRSPLCCSPCNRQSGQVQHSSRSACA